MPSKEDYPVNDCYTPVIIASGQSASNPIDLAGSDLCGIFVPADMVEGPLKITASDRLNGTYSEVLKDETSGQPYTITVSADKYVPVTNLAVVAGLRFIKFVANTPVMASRTLIAASRPI